jgi:glutamine synthetase
MFSNFAETRAFIREKQIKMIDLRFSDLWGRWHHVTVPASAFSARIMDDGVGFDGSSVGFKSVHAGDMILIPDLATAFLDPFWETPTLSFIADTFEADTKQRFNGDPRQILRHAQSYMAGSGAADECLWGPEFEFYVFNRVSMENGVNVASYKVESIEATWNSAEGGYGHYIPLHGGYHAMPPNDQLYNLRSEMALRLQEAGVEIKYHHHEVGGPGQCEIETPLLPTSDAADTIMTIKYFTKMTAKANGQTVTFLPKPLFGEAGNGMHFHQQLRKEGKNVFYDADGPNLLSQNALYYIGGLLAHAPAVLAFTNPSTNSYRRLVPGFEAPVKAFFSSGNRSAAIRVPKYATQPDKVRFEFRPPDATCNPYLAMAAMMLAGLDGIQHKIDPTEAGFGPIDENIFSWPPEKRKTIKSLPTSLNEALAALEADHDFLRVDDIFPETLIEHWINEKSKEVTAVRARPHPFEIQLYFDL